MSLVLNMKEIKALAVLSERIIKVHRTGKLRVDEVSLPHGEYLHVQPATRALPVMRDAVFYAAMWLVTSNGTIYETFFTPKDGLVLGDEVIVNA